MLDWFYQNSKWIFSGIGIPIILWIYGYFCKTESKTRKKIIYIVLLLVIAIGIVQNSFGPQVLPISKPEPYTDWNGHPLQSFANLYELRLILIQDQIMDLLKYKDTVEQPGSRKKLKEAPSLARRILSFDDSNLNPRRRFIKYEFASFAYIDAAAPSMFDEPIKVEGYASQAIKNAETALRILVVAERTYPSNELSRFLLDWIPEHGGQDRVLYLRADAECMLGMVEIDATLKTKAFETWKLISSATRIAQPTERTPQLSPCVPPENSNSEIPLKNRLGSLAHAK